MKRVFLIILIASINISAFASTKEDLVDEIIKLKGIELIYQELKEDSIKQSEAQVESMVSQFKSQLDMIPKEVMDEIWEAAEQCVSEMSKSWSVDGVIAYQRKLMLDFYTKEELAELVEFYRTPLGQKTIEAGRQFSPRIQKYIIERSTPITKKATQTYISDLKKIISQFQSEAIEEN